MRVLIQTHSVPNQLSYTRVVIIKLQYANDINADCNDHHFHFDLLLLFLFLFLLLLSYFSFSSSSIIGTCQHLPFPAEKRCCSLLQNQEAWSSYLFYPIKLWKQKKKNPCFVILFYQKTKNKVLKLGPDFQKWLILGRYWNHWCLFQKSIYIKCINLFLNFQRGTSTLKDKNNFKV